MTVESLPTIAILALPDSSASVVYGMYDLFMAAGRDWGMIVDGVPGPQLLRPVIVGSKPEGVIGANDVRIPVHATLGEIGLPDVVCVAELNVPPSAYDSERFREEAAWLQACFNSGATIATACSAAVLLADTGLLHGQEATTHWAYCDLLRDRYDNITVREQRALVVSGEGQRLIMAGGGTSWLDLTLYVIARCSSVDAAMQVARINLIDWHNVGQQPFARLARTRQVDDAVIGRCQEWIALHYPESSPVAAMTRLSGLAERSFKRRFEQCTGMAPLEYVHTLRLEEAKQMLESCDMPIEAIATEVGYEDAGFFSRLFKRKVNMTPAQYRKRFASLRKELQRAP